MDILRVYCDGGARGNPGPAAIGVAFYHDDRLVASISKTIGVATNNLAEYQAVYAALQQARQLKAKTLEIMGDSELIIRQLNGEYRIKNPELAIWFQRIKELESNFDRIRYSHIPRAENAKADELVNQALDKNNL